MEVKIIVYIAVVIMLLGRGVTEGAQYALVSEGEKKELATKYAAACESLEDKTNSEVGDALEMLEECASRHYLLACPLLLDVYEGKRKGLEEQPSKAYELARQVAELTFAPGVSLSSEESAARAEAMFRLALYYEKGYGCKKSAREAYVWMRRAAMAEHRAAQVEISRYLMNGVGHKPEPRLALLWLMKLSRSAPDAPNLYFYLGYMNMKGVGMNRPDMYRAMYFFEQGALMKDGRATNNLASMYELGIVVDKDTGHALRLYRRAAELGCKEASANLQRLAYKTDKQQLPVTSWQQRVGRASLRMIKALPLDDAVQRWLGMPFRRWIGES